MNYSDILIYIMEMLGSVAFASSGAMLGIERKMDLFGVNVLGVTTAVGGGMIRDLILGITPPVMFQDASYALAAVATSTILFFIVYIRQQLFSGSLAVWYDRIMLICDTIGLGIFTVVGSSAAIDAGYGDNRFLIVFVGVLTGVGGGMIRDMMAGNAVYFCEAHLCGGVPGRRIAFCFDLSISAAPWQHDDRCGFCNAPALFCGEIPVESAAYPLITVPFAVP